MSPRKKEDFETMQQASREKILMAAFALFAKNGYALTSVDSISIKAKVSKGLIYHYFESKQEILKALFHRLVQEGMEIINLNQQLPPKKFLDKLIDFSIDFIINQTKLNRLLIGLTVQPEVTKGLKKEIDKAKEEWMEMLIRPFRELNYESPEAEAYLLGATFDGMSFGYIAIGQEYPINEMKKLIKKRYNL